MPSAARWRPDAVPANPYVVGQWVKGRRFYGRASQVEEILEGHRNWIWLLGTRRIGKTSLLKQLELLASSAPEKEYFPLFWDFQGADSVEELHRTFREAIFDAGERLEELSIDPDSLGAPDLFDSLLELRRRLKRSKIKTLLLCDEVEELIKLNQTDPSLLPKLRREMQSSEDVRSVLASTIRLWTLADVRGDTSPFLHGFTPPVYIRGLSDEEARALILQTKVREEADPAFSDEVVKRIRAMCDNHPYLIQLVCKRFLELGSLEEAIESVVSDGMVRYFFEVDFDMLEEQEKGVIRVIAEASQATSDSILARLSASQNEVNGILQRLDHLGFIRRNDRAQYELVNYFFRRWFQDRPVAPEDRMSGTAGGSETHQSESPTIAIGANSNLLAGRYRLSKQLGGGGMGVVYKALDTVLGQQIAIKILRTDVSARAHAVERFRREVVLARDLNHPNIVPVYDIGDSADRKFITMKLVEGPTVEHLIRRNGPLEIGRTLNLITKVASALDAAHRKGVIHRDVKPANVLTDPEGEPFLTDFGLARLMSLPGVTQEGLFLGTPEYASPEQARMKPVDARSDVYSLGLVLYEMLTGAVPFRADSVEELLRMHQSLPAPDPKLKRPEIPERVSRIVLRCLEKEPSARFQSARGLQDALSDPAA